ncbi:MAG: hypothetical protein F4174_03585 [Acidobacteria bacterium]|nr:hypothetical protein [Acidobacteriota bacterium]
MGPDHKGAVPVGRAQRVPQDEAARGLAGRQPPARRDGSEEPLRDQRVAVDASRKERLAASMDIEIEAGIAGEADEGAHQNRERQQPVVELT